METISLGYIVFDFVSESIFLSPYVQKIFQQKSPHVKNLDPLVAFVPSNEKTDVTAFFKEIPSPHFSGGTIELKITQEKAPPRIIRVSFGNPFKEKGKSIYSLGVVQDLTEEKYSQLIVESCLDGAFIRKFKDDLALFSGKIFESLCLRTDCYCTNAMLTYNCITYPDDNAFFERHSRHVSSSLPYRTQLVYRINDKDSNPLWISKRTQLFFDEHNQLEMVIGGYINIQPLRSVHPFNQSIFETCFVTGLFNRYRLFHDLTQCAHNRNERGFLLFINIDNFSHVNTIYGYEAGDTLLRHVAKILKEHTRDDCTLYRCESDRFFLLMRGANESRAQEQLDAFREGAQKPCMISGSPYSYHLTIVGIPYDWKNIAPEISIKKGVIAVASVREHDKGNFVLLKNSFFRKYGAKFEIENQLRRCVLKNMKEFFIVYQPLVDAKSKKCIAAEALLRWKDNNGKVIMPENFIPVLDELGLMDIVGIWVLKKASLQCKQWVQNGFGNSFSMSVNITATLLSDNRFAEMLLEHLKAINLPTRHIVVEITENNLMLDFQRGMKQLNTLKENGVRVAIDDFGTGYSSLSYLKTLPVDEIKIDQSFVKDIENDDYSREFVSSIIKITQRVGRTVCVEGVETRSQEKILQAMNADTFQGFLYGKPQKSDPFQRLFLLNRAVR